VCSSDLLDNSKFQLKKVKNNADIKNIF